MLYSNNIKSKASYLYQKSQSSQSSQVEQQQSSCSQCKRKTYGIREEQDQDQSSVVQRRHRSIESSQQEEQKISAPMRKHINNKNYEFQEMLRLLQYQVDTLKRQNQTKDEIIKDLKFHVQKNILQEERKRQNDKQLYEISRIRQELSCSPRNNTLGIQGKGFRAPSSRKYNNSGETAHKQNYYEKDYKNNQTNMLQSFNPLLYNQRQLQLLHHNPQTHIPHQADYELKMALLQKQLRQYQLQMMQQKQHITKLQQENKWQQKFIISFVKMCDQLSLNYGQKLKLNKLGDDLKKKTKFSWNYMKNIVAYFIQVINKNSFSQT